MQSDGRRRVVIENVTPEIECGTYPIKRAVGERVNVEADIFADGHDVVSAVLLYKHPQDNDWHPIPMRYVENDRWHGHFQITQMGTYLYTFEGWIDHFKSWQRDIEKKHAVGQEIHVDLLIGVNLIEAAAKRAKGSDAEILKTYATTIREEQDQTKAVALAFEKQLIDLMDLYVNKDFANRYDKELKVLAERSRAAFSAWYELFPRSTSKVEGQHGTFADVERLLPEIVAMGFDVLYLPPIHPIGTTARKGKNNAVTAQPGEPGSPWAIGSTKGGHQAIHPELGTEQDFERLVTKAKEYDIEIALDLAYQCSPDHPYVQEHPEWFRWRPDGSVQYAENPPKKYQDVLPINFETDNWQALWEELKRVVLYWIDKGVHIFRVDNPHTKPLAFWDWLIRGVQAEYPDVIFLSEAFTRPKVMYRLAKVGFTQSYTYFTWRNTKHEFIEYINELTQSEVRDYFRPNFWPNTPDILADHLQYGGRNAFVIRFLLAATLSSNYGIYGPAFELCVNEAVPGREEYYNSEKYEIKTWNRNQPGNLKSLIQHVNRIRRAHPAFHRTNNIRFLHIDNDQILAFLKHDEESQSSALVVINLDIHSTQAGMVELPLEDLGMNEHDPYLAHDLLSNEKYIWQGRSNYVELHHETYPAHILNIRPRLHREQDFDYFM